MAAPIAAGKWTIRDIIAHIMLWDKYIFEQAVQRISEHQSVTVQHLNFDEFNKNAVQFAETKGKQEILDMTIHYRSEILRCLSLVPENEFVTEHVDGDGNKFSLHNYVNDFIPHDNQHIDQIKAFLV